MLKKFIPTTLFGRFLIIIVMPTIIVQIVAVYVFYYTHIDRVSKYMAQNLLREMLVIKESIFQSNDEKFLRLFEKNIDIKFRYKEEERLTKFAKISKKDYKPPKIFNVIDVLPIFDSLNRFKIELKNHNFSPFAIYKDLKDEDRLIIKVSLENNELKQNGVLTYNIPKKRITNSSKTVFIIWFLTISLLTTIIAIVFLKNQLKSIKGLSQAAEKFGRGQRVGSFKPSGAKEIRSVGVSFIKMKQRLARQIEQRTVMLSGVSHDLRTPLTRMKLQLELLEENDAIKDLKLDISDMEKMINEYLEFAKGGNKENSQKVNIQDFLKNIVKYYKKLNKSLQYNIKLPDNLEINISKTSFRRAMINLIDNGFNHADKVDLNAILKNNNLEITVDDNGVGVEDSEMQNIFKPFYRVDNSRNLDKIGTGLGLAIVLDVISFHGGTVLAKKSTMGGLKIIINLPI